MLRGGWNKSHTFAPTLKAMPELPSSLGAPHLCSPFPGHTDPPSATAMGQPLVPSSPAHVDPTPPVSPQPSLARPSPIREPPKEIKFLHCHHPLSGASPFVAQDSSSKRVIMYYLFNPGFPDWTVTSASVCPGLQPRAHNRRPVIVW